NSSINHSENAMRIIKTFSHYVDVKPVAKIVSKLSPQSGLVHRLSIAPPARRERRALPLPDCGPLAGRGRIARLRAIRVRGDSPQQMRSPDGAISGLNLSA